MVTLQFQLPGRLTCLDIPTAQHDAALIAELQHRGIDVSSVYDGTSISFAHHVTLDGSAMNLVIQS